MLIGLIGIAAIVPFAGRQTADSYQIVQTLATGQNTIEFANSNQVFRPSLSAPWQLIDDGAANPTDSAKTFFVSMDRLYGTLYSESLPSSPTLLQQFIIANSVLGTGFCMDPYFWGNQFRYSFKLPVSGANSWGNFRRTRFPFYNESFPQSYDPFGTGATQTTPRLLRVSLRDPSGADVNGNNGWLRMDASRLIANMGGGDVTSSTPESDKSAAPLRTFATGHRDWTE